MTNSQLLISIIKESGFKLKAVAKKMNLSPYGLQRKINNTVEFKAGEISRLCKILNIESCQQKEQIFLPIKVILIHARV
ncbi:MAG: helix-turn-helix domain-containing protein [Oscillospiraceae bacterium]|nr:helix-turn-helix domain-containing protein [Oscillospiraceae bacterium]